MIKITHISNLSISNIKQKTMKLKINLMIQKMLIFAKSIKNINVRNEYENNF